MLSICTMAKKADTSPLGRAKEKVGGASGLARALGGSVSPQAISQWKQVPAERVLDVERATGISRTELRADLYPSEAGQVA
jgi:DNA-binding transcriptional regulator YdaS (Cro superfamily)